MTLSLLATKLYIPNPDLELVSRPHLNGRMDAGLRGRLILLSAPAGFGKTTLVANWIQQLSSQSSVYKCWLSLDESDNTPIRFWTYFISALQAADSQIGEAAMTAFQSPQPPLIESVLISLINDLARFSNTIILVLDDYHTITTPEIHAAQDFFIERLPQNFHMVIATREDPPLALPRLRARGQLTEIRTSDLRFSQTEADELLNNRMSLEIVPRDITSLTERTEGWITGLRLAAISLQNETDKHGFIDAFTVSHRFLTDYLVDEVLSRQEPGLRTFLTHTSILHRFCAALCDYVVGETNSQQTLRHLEQVNLFLVPLDNARLWYRYHHLFAEFLRLHLKATEGDILPHLYQRAMEWCSAHNLEREALTYALEIPDYERAAVLIEGLAAEVLSNEGPSPVLQWMALLPETIIHERPFLCIHYAWALTFSGGMDTAADYLEFAVLAAAKIVNNTEKNVIQGYIAAHRAYLLFFKGEYVQTIEYARQALEQLPVEDEVMRARTAVFLGNGLRYAGQLQASAEAHSLAAAASQKTGNVYTANLNYVSLAELYLEQAKLHQAMEIYHQALEFTRRRSGRSDIPFTGFAYFAIGRIHREWNNLETASEFINKGVDLCREWRQADALVIGLIELAILQQDLGVYALANQALEDAMGIVEPISKWGIATVNAFITRLNLAQGNLAGASQWAETSGISPQDGLSFERGAEYISLAQVLIAQEKYTQAIGLLDKLYRLYKTAGRTGRLIEVFIWQSRAFAGIGNISAALSTLKEAMAIGEPENFVRSFVAGGQIIVELMRQQPASDYLHTLLEAFGKIDTSFVKISQSESILPEPLNEREMAVLRYLAGGLSNQEIGAEMYLSVNTIRWYAGQIYLKLAVTGRGQAVARARQLGIL